MTDAEMIADREDIADVLHIVALDGLPGPRDLDVAIDAIDAVYQPRLLALAKEAQAARAEAERLREVCDCQHDALARIAQWADAYPRDVFTPLSDCDIKQIRQVVTDAGFSFGALHASWARHLVDGIGGIARAAIQEQRDD